MLSLMRQFPLASIILAEDHEDLVFHLPLIYCDGKLIGILKKHHPNADYFKNNQTVSIAFSGPQHEMLSNIQNTEQELMWSYIEVNLKGIVKEINHSDIIKWSLISMIDTFELHKVYDSFFLNKKIESLTNIRGFEILITHWKGKHLTKKKSEETFRLASQKLIEHNQKHIKVFFDSLFN